MKTLTAEQFKKQFGEGGVSQFNNNLESQQGYLSKVAGAIKENVGDATRNFSNYLESPNKTLGSGIATGANIAKNVSGSLLTPVSVALAPIFERTVVPLTDKIIGTRPAQKLIDVLSKNPELVGVVADTLETGLNMAGVQGTISALKSGSGFVRSQSKKLTAETPPPKGGTPPSSLEISANKTSAGIMNRVARLKPSDEAKFKKMSGKTPGEYLQETGNFGSPDKIIQAESSKFLRSKATVDAEFAKLPGVYQSGPVLDALNGLLQRAKTVSSGNVKASYLSQVESLLAKYKKGGLTMEEINLVKRLYERHVKLGYNKLLNSEKVEQATNIDNAMRNWQIQQARQLGFKNVDVLNKQTQLSKFIIDKLGDQLIGQSALNAISLTDWIMLSGGDVASISGFLTKKFFSSKAIQAKIAEILNSKEIQGMIEADIGPTNILQLPAPTTNIRSLIGSGQTIKVPPKGSNIDIVNQ